MLIKTINSYGKDNNEGIQPSSMKKDGKLHARNVSITKENNLISNWLKDYGDPPLINWRSVIWPLPSSIAIHLA